MKNKLCYELNELLSLDYVKDLEQKYDEYIHTLQCIACFAGNKPDYSSSTLIHHERVSKCFGRYKRTTNFHGLPLCDFHHNERHRKGIKVYEQWFGSSEAHILWAKSLAIEFFKNFGVSITHESNDTFDYLLYKLLRAFLLGMSISEEDDAVV